MRPFRRPGVGSGWSWWLLVFAFAVGLVGCGGGAGTHATSTSGIPAPPGAWTTFFRHEWSYDESQNPVMDTFYGRYTPALVAKLNACGAGQKELTVLQHAVTSVPKNSSLEPSSLDFTTVQGPPYFAFKLTKEAYSLYWLLSCRRSQSRA